MTEVITAQLPPSPPCPSCDASLTITHPTERVAVWNIQHAPACPYMRSHNRTARRALRRKGGRR